MQEQSNKNLQRTENNCYYENDTKIDVPFEIPNSWIWCRFNSVVTINPTVNEAKDKLAGFVPMKYIKDGYSNEFIYDIRKWDDINKGFTKFQNNDVAFAKITPCFENRKSMILRNLPNSLGAGTTELHILRTNNKMILPQYVLWFIKSEYFIQYGKDNFSGTAGQQRFGTPELKKLLFPLPSINEQVKIVSIIEKLFQELAL